MRRHNGSVKHYYNFDNSCAYPKHDVDGPPPFYAKLWLSEPVGSILSVLVLESILLEYFLQFHFFVKGTAVVAFTASQLFDPHFLLLSHPIQSLPITLWYSDSAKWFRINNHRLRHIPLPHGFLDLARATRVLRFLTLHDLRLPNQTLATI